MTSEAATEEDLDMTNSDNEASEDEQVRVEAWLDENPEFFQEYLIRKGTRCMVDSWLVAHALPPGITTTLHNVEETDENDDDVNDTSNTWSNNSCSQLTQTEQQQQETNNA